MHRRRLAVTLLLTPEIFVRIDFPLIPVNAVGAGGSVGHLSTRRHFAAVFPIRERCLVPLRAETLDTEKIFEQGMDIAAAPARTTHHEQGTEKNDRVEQCHGRVDEDDESELKENIKIGKEHEEGCARRGDGSKSDGRAEMRQSLLDSRVLQ